MYSKVTIVYNTIVYLNVATTDLKYSHHADTQRQLYAVMEVLINSIVVIILLNIYIYI